MTEVQKEIWLVKSSIFHSSCLCSLPACPMLRDIGHKVWVVSREADKKRTIVLFLLSKCTVYGFLSLQTPSKQGMQRRKLSNDEISCMSLLSNNRCVAIREWKKNNLLTFFFAFPFSYQPLFAEGLKGKKPIYTGFHQHSQAAQSLSIPT